MPSLLRRDTIRLLEGSVNCLHLAVLGLGVPRLQTRRAPQADLCAEIGLIGASIELAISACLVQVSGPSALLLPDGRFKPAAQVAEELLTLLRAPAPALDFLVQDVPNREEHIGVLLDRCRRFRLLATMRAGGLHAGHAPPRPVCVTQANYAADFLAHLGASTRLRPYLSRVPRVPDPLPEAVVLLEDLQRQLRTARSMRDQAGHLVSMFLVLPEVPDNMPEWLGALERVSVIPRKRDMTLLLGAIEASIPVSLRKTKAGGTPIPVVVEPSNPEAIAIAPHYLKTAFTQSPDRFGADVANANGRLDDGVLDLPPQDFVRELGALGFEEPHILLPGQDLTAHQAWPFIAASLAIQGTPGPYWFLVRRCNDLGQLVALLGRAAAGGPRLLQKNLAVASPGIEAIRSGGRVPAGGRYAELLRYRDRVRERRVRLDEKVDASFGTDHRLPPDLESALGAVQEDEDPVGPLLLSLLTADPGHPRVLVDYWCRVLSEVALVREDMPGLLGVLRRHLRNGAHTSARKAFEMIDFLSYGPNVDPGSSAFRTAP